MSTKNTLRQLRFRVVKYLNSTWCSTGLGLASLVVGFCAVGLDVAVRVCQGSSISKSAGISNSSRSLFVDPLVQLSLPHTPATRTRSSSANVPFGRRRPPNNTASATVASMLLVPNTAVSVADCCGCNAMRATADCTPRRDGAADDLDGDGDEDLIDMYLPADAVPASLRRTTHPGVRQDSRRKTAVTRPTLAPIVGRYVETACSRWAWLTYTTLRGTFCCGLVR